MMSKDKNAEVIATLRFALGKLRLSSLIENRKMNGASQRKINRIVEAGDIIKSLAPPGMTNSKDDVLHQLTLTRIICIIMKTATFFSKACSFHDQITNGDHISKLEQLRR